MTEVPWTLRWGTESPECLLRADTQTFWLSSLEGERLEEPGWAQAGGCVCLESLDVLVFVLGNPQPLILEGRLGGEVDVGTRRITRPCLSEPDLVGEDLGL